MWINVCVLYICASAYLCSEFEQQFVALYATLKHIFVHTYICYAPALRLTQPSICANFRAASFNIASNRCHCEWHNEARAPSKYVVLKY